MSMIFDVDLTELNKLRKFFKKSPRQFNQASAGVLNSIAFAAKKYMFEAIKKETIVRSPQFISKSIRVQKARASNQIAITGTIIRPGFTGMKEQELGETSREKKRFTSSGRGGSLQRRVPKRYRMKSGRKFLRSDNITPKINRYKSVEHRTIIFIQMMSRRKREPFYIHQPFGKMRKGLYEFKGRRLHMIARTENLRRPRRTKIREITWRFIRTRIDINKLWADNIQKIINRYK